MSVKHIWVVEIQTPTQGDVPVDFELTLREAKKLAAIWKSCGTKAKVIKYTKTIAGSK